MSRKAAIVSSRTCPGFVLLYNQICNLQLDLYQARPTTLYICTSRVLQCFRFVPRHCIIKCEVVPNEPQRRRCVKPNLPGVCTSLHLDLYFTTGFVPGVPQRCKFVLVVSFNL